MNYDRIILELMNRVQVLEQQVAEIQASIGDENPASQGAGDGSDVSRSEARDKAMDSLRKQYPTYLVEKASRKEGSGIKLIKSQPGFEGAVIIKFFHSKMHGDPARGGHGWHVVNVDEVIGTMIDFVMFSVVDLDGNWSFLIFKPSELGEYRDKHRSGDSEWLHLYFAVRDEKAVELREDVVDVTDHLNNWGVLK